MKDFQEIVKLSETIQDKFMNALDDKESYDARSVALACANIAGTYLSLIKEPAVRVAFVESFLNAFIKTANAPFRITRVN